MKHFLTLISLLVLSSGAYASSSVPQVKFDHKRMNIHMLLTFEKMKKLEKYMPRSMREEIGRDYYPYIRREMGQSDSAVYKDAKINKTVTNDGLMNLTLEFPHYYLIFLDVTWEDLDSLFRKYFEPYLSTT